MRRRIFTLFITSIAILLFTLTVDGQTAHAVSGTFTTLSFPDCGHFQLGGGTVQTVFGESGSIFITDGNGTTLFPPSLLFNTFTFTSLSIPFVTPPATNPIHVILSISGTTIADVTANDPCLENTASSVVTWFTSGDTRLNGQPGDRLVVYCNAKQTPPNVDVWVIDGSSVGHELAKLPLSDLTSVAGGKFAKNLGVNGVIFAGSDASGNGYAALQGGPYGGTAKGDWLKTFSCKAS